MAENHAGASAVARLEAVQDRIGRAARAANRDPSDVTLIAVSKTYAPDAIRPLLDAGHRDFGENRVQEAKAKWPAKGFPLTRLHLIGPLQSNKVADAVKLFDMIHTIDREKIARAVATESVRQERRPGVLVQVNTGLEPQKAGVKPDEAVDFLEFCGQELKLRVAGFMCIPPVDEDPAKHFALLAALAAKYPAPGLSMGMTGDFETAIAHGATWVRVGSAIFGERA